MRYAKYLKQSRACHLCIFLDHTLFFVREPVQSEELYWDVVESLSSNPLNVVSCQVCQYADLDF